MQILLDKIYLVALMWLVIAMVSNTLLIFTLPPSGITLIGYGTFLVLGIPAAIWGIGTSTNKHPKFLLYWSCYVLMILGWFAYAYKYWGLLNTSTNLVVHDAFASIYFSIVTFTTLGYGDFIPANNAVRAAASGEAVFGYIVLALFVIALGNSLRR